MCDACLWPPSQQICRFMPAASSSSTYSHTLSHHRACPYSAVHRLSCLCTSRPTQSMHDAQHQGSDTMPCWLQAELGTGWLMRADGFGKYYSGELVVVSGGQAQFGDGDETYDAGGGGFVTICLVMQVSLTAPCAAFAALFSFTAGARAGRKLLRTRLSTAPCTILLSLAVFWSPLQSVLAQQQLIFVWLCTCAVRR